MVQNKRAIAMVRPTRLEYTFIAAGLSLMFFAAGWVVHDVNQSTAYSVYTADRA